MKNTLKMHSSVSKSTFVIYKILQSFLTLSDILRIETLTTYYDMGVFMFKHMYVNVLT